ncbi:MAG: hypothetical protein IPP51_01815 [Bacteroidetes bacterium]|nr:hypothetical protein [Bacteroidota bacterium]
MDTFLIGFFDPLEYFHCERVDDGSLKLVWDRSIKSGLISGHVSIEYNETNFNFLRLGTKKQVLESEPAFKAMVGDEMFTLSEARVLYEEGKYEECIEKVNSIQDIQNLELDCLWLSVNVC